MVGNSIYEEEYEMNKTWQSVIIMTKSLSRITKLPELDRNDKTKTKNENSDVFQIYET